MLNNQRSPNNPILSPNKQNPWEAHASFNGCVIKDNNAFHLFYRAMSEFQDYQGVQLRLSTIGKAVSTDGIHFANRRLLIKPEYEWEKFGCEDPRITKLDDKYFISYTALSSYPPTPPGIKIGVAITKDLQTIQEKHLVTPFNSKAMALFPKRINNRIVGILTANTDIPPAKIAIASFNSEEQIWSQDYWRGWYSSLENCTLPLQRTKNDQVEVGAPPLETKDGWLLLYAYIKNYYSPKRIFGIEAVLLDLENPLSIIGRIKEPLLIPKNKYELYGNVPNVIFPSGALVVKDKLYIYYGAADTTCCLATCKLKDILSKMERGNEDEQ